MDINFAMSPRYEISLQFFPKNLGKKLNPHVLFLTSMAAPGIGIA